MAKLKISAQSSITNVTYPNPQNDRFVGPEIIDGYHQGGTGGLTSLSGQQIQPQVYIKNGSSLPGSIIFQKGAHKFRVTDGTLTGDCSLVNSPTLSAGQMNVVINRFSVSAAITAANVAGGATSTYVTWTAGTTTGPVSTPRVGDYIVGFTSANIPATGAQITAVNSTSNVTIAVSGNVAGATGVSITESTYASRITNKFVYDFTSDGQPLTSNGTITYYSSGYNPTKYRYRLATPDATFVQVASA